MAVLNVEALLAKFQNRLGQYEGQHIVDELQYQTDMQDKADIIAALNIEIDRLRAVLDEHSLGEFREPPKGEDNPPGSESVHPGEPGATKSNPATEQEVGDSKEDLTKTPVKEGESSS